MDEGWMETFHPSNHIHPTYHASSATKRWEMNFLTWSAYHLTLSQITRDVIEAARILKFMCMGINFYRAKHPDMHIFK